MKQLGVLFLVMHLLSTAYAQPATPVKIIDNYQGITSISQLLSSFKGKPVFVDMWATWCEPCREEFKHNAFLYSYLQKKNIAMLYVSVDKEEQDIVWRKDIINLELKGSHIRANKALQNELSTLIWGAPGGFSIPHYLLFDSNGKLLLKDAAPPSNLAELKRQVAGKGI